MFTRAELESRAEIQYEIYAKAINIEAKAMIDIATKQIIPAVIKYTTVLAESINAVKAAGAVDVSVQMDLLEALLCTFEEYQQCHEQAFQGCSKGAVGSGGAGTCRILQRKGRESNGSPERAGG